MSARMFKFLILLLVPICTFGQFKDNSIGVVYLDAENSAAYSVTIVFPVQMLSESANDQTTLSFSGNLHLFDEKGELGFIKGPVKFKLKQWCDNDGGLQVRPTLMTTIAKSNLKRKLNGRKQIQNIACFITAGPSNVSVEPTDLAAAKNIVITGDLNNDGIVDCFISTYSDDAKNCDGQPVNHLGIMLLVDGVPYLLRCCGP
jgi:hypothetical protein